MSKLNKMNEMQALEAPQDLQFEEVLLEGGLPIDPGTFAKEFLMQSGLIDLIKAVIAKKDAQTSTWLDSDQAAAYLGIPKGQLRNLSSDGKVPHYKFGRLNRYLRSDLDALLRKDRRGGE